MRLSDQDVDAFLADPVRKQSFVTPMFDIIAPRYDTFTRLFSFGMDAAWKRELLAMVRELLPRVDSPLMLDLASGTGDLATALARQVPTGRVLALDASPRMVQEARVRLKDDPLSHRVEFRIGDMQSMDVESASVDVVTAGYGVRNAPNAHQTIAEIARVMKPGALLVTLDFFRPEWQPWRFLLLRYLAVAGNVVGWLWYRDPVVYGYIARSIDHFMSWQKFGSLLEANGMRVLTVKRHLGGGIALHAAVKRA